MSTVIYPSPIFGPIHSRRLGVSLGINLMPPDGKVCSFDCIYCECGFNSDRRPHSKIPTHEEVTKALEERLRDTKANGPKPDVLTFAGNGEPTSHPRFAAIMADVIRLRNEYFPQAKVSVLSNSTFIHRPEVREALMTVDNNILKLDTIDPDYINRVDRPVGAYDVRRVIEDMKSFHGHLIIQTMFMKGNYRGESVDNTTDTYVLPWLDTIREIAPREVMVYTIDRETPATGLEKATRAELDSIRDRVIALGIPCQASY